MFSIENVSEQSKNKMLDFLKKNEDYCMFMLGNFEAHGYEMSDAPNSGNYKLIISSDDLVGVFCLTRRGTLLIHCEIQGSIFEQITECCKGEEVAIRCVIGEWNLCNCFWTFLKLNQVITSETFVSKEILYSVNLSDKIYPGDSQVKLLSEADFPFWKRLYCEYRCEQKLPSDLNEDQLRNQFHEKSKNKSSWGLFQDNKLVSIADLNAKALDLGQVGGVYTSPEHRKQGLAKALMRQLIMDVKKLHVIRKLIIFTNEDNIAARKVYESLGANQIGYYALLFGHSKS